MMDGDWAGGGSWLWMLGGLLLVIGVILVVWLVMRTSRAGQPPTRGLPGPTPDQVLAERFARGEITREEFDQARNALNPDR